MNNTIAHYDSGAERLSRPVMALLIVLILFVTLIRGGNRGVALIAMEWLALAVALLLLARWLGGNRWQALVTAAPDAVAMGLLVLSPLWVPLLKALTAREGVFTVTGFSAMAGLPLAVCLLTVRSASADQGITLRKLWLGVVLLQALMGLAQLSGAKALFFGLETPEPIIGTFASKNTYANLLVMAIPLAVWQFFEALPGSTSGTAMRREKKSVLWGWGLGTFLLIVTVMLTTSRTGIVTGLLVFVLSVVLLMPRRVQSRWNAWGWSVGAVALVVGALLAGGLDWASRFDAERLASDYDFRAAMRSATEGAALAQLPLGSGLGSFPWVSAGFQPAEAGRFWFDLAHNDYMQILAETGLAGALLITAGLWLFLRRGWVLVQLAGSSHALAAREAKAGLASALGLLAFGLHAWVDYPFHIPANAMMAATLMGLMCRPLTAESQGNHIRKPF